ncbi:murein L,D-transpeptidase catalytic domain family protein [Novosphingobium sp. TH158]|uniref:murein L,D-transpeptidase catalytic domain family protein n=1 Tax=Novosphingobium sp. TH158 TaxID=2067455 RepID=UPI000C79CFDF|nr:murein L,D-transpeptidase catalytic domain family protein [Novosphingobium sp. TH158]PLK27310.1 twin-arginine translocation pathway signal [Novosphingobium sp. TH158]
MLAPVSRALAQSLEGEFDKAFGMGANPAPVPVEPAPVVPSLPMQTASNPAYDARLLEIARREIGRAGNRLWRTDIVGIADFARPSTLPRFHFVNLEAGRIDSFRVTHGRGSDPEHSGFLHSFSNVPGSEATSRGAYVTCEWYYGKYGTSIRLEGMDRDNSNARERAIVMHPAAYAAPEHIARFGKLGRSEGCFAMSPGDFTQALAHLSGGRLLYADRISLT